MKKILVLTAIISIGTNQLFAQTCCSGGVPLTNNIGGLPLSSKGTWQFSLSADLNVLKTLKEGSEVLNDDARERNTLSVLLKSSYSISDKLFIESLSSWVQQERIINQVGGFGSFDQTRGIGDWVILANYLYLNKKGWDLIAGAGPKFATGKSDLRNVNDLSLNADLQPGSGANDAVFIHRIIKTDLKKPTRSFFSNFTYRLTGINTTYLGNETYQFGDELQILAGYSDQVMLNKTLLSFGFNVRYRHAGEDLFNSEIMPNTGGDFVFIMPVLGWYVHPNLVVSFNSEIPLYARVVGTQLSPSYRLNGGVYFTIPKKQKIESNYQF